MQSALSEHNGIRLQDLSPEVQVIDRLTADHCKFSVETTQFEVVHYDFGDIDTRTIKVQQIGKSWWVVFDTRNFNKSVQYRRPQDPGSDYYANRGGFSLDSQSVADSFAKAVTHAANLCGSGPSTF
jgi:hypothetical protein